MLFSRKTLRALVLMLPLSGSVTAVAASVTSSSLISSTTSCTASSFAPIRIPIHNVTLKDQTSRRGAGLLIGTPPQELAFNVHDMMNNTYIYDETNPCNSGRGLPSNASELECSTWFGGLFNMNVSSTWSPAANAATLGLPTEASYTNASTYFYGSDTLQVNQSTSLPKFPLGVALGQRDAMNTLGIGRNSSFLNSLASTKAIASRTWGFFNGWTGADSPHQKDGSLVLGGYDVASTVGTNITLPFKEASSNGANCYSGMFVTVMDIKMNLKNGSSPSIFGGSRGSATVFCILTHWTAISIPVNMWDLFVNISSSNPVGRSTSSLNFFQMLIATDGAYDGDLTFSIDPGLEITIPNHQLINPDVDINSDGQEYIKNGSNRVMPLYSLQDVNQNDMPVLGMPFLSSAYLFVDDDHKQFTIWKGQPSETQNLVPAGAPECNSSAPIPTSSATPLPNPPAPKPVKSSNKGAIAGGIIGGIAVIALCFGVYYLVSRRHAQKLQEAKVRDESKGHEFDSLFGSPSDKPELPSNQHPPQEMALSKDPDYSVSPYEMPGKNPAQEMPLSQDQVSTTSPCEMPGTKVAASELPATPRKLGVSSGEVSAPEEAASPVGYQRLGTIG